jgi:hypothetical protein
MSELNTAAQDENLLPGGALAKACRYALNLRAQLRRSLENGVTEIDNNRCEQSIRPIALGRKNWLHTGVPGAAPSVAALAATLTPGRWLAVRTPAAAQALAAPARNPAW